MGLPLPPGGERGVYRLRGLLALAEQNVGVEVHRDTDPRVAEHPRDHVRRNARLQRQGRARVPQVVEANEYLPGLRSKQRGQVFI